MKTIDKIITPVSCKYGSPIGRPDVLPDGHSLDNIIITFGKKHSKLVDPKTKTSKIIFDCAVPMNGAYDKGGAYWGLGDELRVQYTKDLTFVEFYRSY